MVGTRKTIALDFDGVVHKYSKGYHDGTCYDEPFPDVFDAIEQMLGSYNVFIFSTRDPQQIAEWFAKYEVPFPVQVIPQDYPHAPFWLEEGVLGITNRKYVAKVYVDDRALRWEPKFRWLTRLHIVLSEM